VTTRQEEGRADVPTRSNGDVRRFPSRGHCAACNATARLGDASKAIGAGCWRSGRANGERLYCLRGRLTPRGNRLFGQATPGPTSSLEPRTLPDPSGRLRKPEEPLGTQTGPAAARPGRIVEAVGGASELQIWLERLI